MSPALSDADEGSKTLKSLPQVAEATAQCSDAKPLSKNQQKKLLKRARWEEGAESRREARRHKKRALKEKKKLERLEGQDQASTAALDDGSEKRPTSKPMTNPKKLSALVAPSKMRIIVDCAFDDKMLDKEIGSLEVQVTRCYSSNQRARPSCQLVVSSFGARLEERMNLVFGKDYKRWRQTVFTGLGFIEYCKGQGDPVESIVYLTGDSPNTLETLSEDELYVVGGIVDRNREKNLCLDKAKSLGVRHAKLPIGEHLNLASRKILTTNHVVEILLRYLETRDWKESLLYVLPKRKGASEKKK